MIYLQQKGSILPFGFARQFLYCLSALRSSVHISRVVNHERYIKSSTVLGLTYFILQARKHVCYVLFYHDRDNHDNIVCLIITRTVVRRAINFGAFNIYSHNIANKV